MCYHKSYVIIESGKILSHPLSDHHSDIRLYHGIRDDMHTDRVSNLAIEYQPVTDLFNIAGWRHVMDQPRKPEWYDDFQYQKLQEQLVSDFKRMCKPSEKLYQREGSIELPYLKRLPVGARIVSGKEVTLGSLVDMTGVTIECDVFKYMSTENIKPMMIANPPSRNSIRCRSVVMADPDMEEGSRMTKYLIDTKQLVVTG